MNGFEKMMTFVIIPLLLLMFICVVLVLSGHSNVGIALSIIGTPLVLLVTMIYIVAIDSKKRWPELHWTDRLTKVLTLQR